MLRLSRVAATACAVPLALPAVASARAGGGSFHFGGGGGGFRGGGRGFGHGHFFFGIGGVWLLYVILAVVALLIVLAVVSWLKREALAARLRARRQRRARRVELAAAEAAEDDPQFAPDVVRPAAEALFREVQRAWDARDRDELARRLGPELLAEWTRRLDDFDRRGWHNRVEVVATVEIQYVGLVNRAADEDDRVVVHVATRLRDYVVDRGGHRVSRRETPTEVSAVAEYWTLGKRDGRWILLSIEQEQEGAHVLDDVLVASPWSDDSALRDDALVEGAAATRLPESVSVGEIADLDFTGSARAAALDLSLADGRFAPDVLEVAVRRAVEGWAEAVDGEDGKLLAVATPEAAHRLLHTRGTDTRLVVRGPRTDRVSITAVDAGAHPPAVSLELHMRGRRYVENRATAQILSGSQSREVNWVERWTLVLDQDEHNPWRLAAAADVGEGQFQPVRAG